ncbi:MAG TPA: hypothetical protein VH110_07175 [Candidatus Acidoferrum sp.]|nr:hypothetical protein [Candidatus Acidoferrum sp.]
MTKNNLMSGLLFCLLASTRLCAQTPAPTGTTSETSRDPFTVKFQFDDKRKVEQQFGKTPYVSEKTIHVFPGEEFGINLRLEGEEIVEVSYQPDLQKTDVKFKFEVQKLGKQSMMMLTIKSNLDKTLVMDAGMLLPGYKEPVKTSMAPVWPHLMGIETWPQPILKLELKNLRLEAAPKGLAGPPK